MQIYPIISLSDHPERLDEMAEWFHNKWSVPKSAYVDSMTDSLRGTAPFPQWYVATDGNTIIGGLGIIENDFHERKDLSPNVCAVYVEPQYRCQGIAGALLRRVCNDMAKKGLDTLYLLTDHTGFYERYGWEFLCMVLGDGEEKPSRMYVHRT